MRGSGNRTLSGAAGDAARRLPKLRKLEAEFAKIDPHRHPKMLVVCEDTTVSPWWRAATRKGLR